MYCKSDLEEKILDICRNEYSYFLNKKNVMGVGLSYKIQIVLIHAENVLRSM